MPLKECYLQVQARVMHTQQTVVVRVRNSRWGEGWAGWLPWGCCEWVSESYCKTHWPMGTPVNLNKLGLGHPSLVPLAWLHQAILKIMHLNSSKRSESSPWLLRFSKRLLFNSFIFLITFFKIKIKICTFNKSKTLSFQIRHLSHERRYINASYYSHCVVQSDSAVLHSSQTGKHSFYYVICNRSTHFTAGHHPLM